MLKNLAAYLLDILFPPRCPLCRCYTAAQALFCPACLRHILSVRRVPLNRRDVKHLHTVYALTQYDSGVDKLISGLKYRRDLRYLPHMQALVQMYAPHELRADLVVPIPLHHDKLRERGFNQAEKIFAPWSRTAGFRWRDDLERTRATLPQYTLKAAERRQNVNGAFALKENFGVSGKSILLVDDIFTTGTTMEACAKILRQAGAARIDGLVFGSDA